jgi:hypothetical protein
MAVLDVAVRERRRGVQRLVGDLAAVVRLVAVAQPAQDLHGVVDRRLVDADLLEAPLQRRVALEVLAVLVERRRADRLQLTAGQGRLEDRRCVDSTFRRTGTDEVMQLVDEQDDVAALLDFLHDLLQPLFELAAVLRAGDERGEVERVDLLALQQLGHLAVGDALCEPFDDGGLADAGLADQHGLFFWRRERICMIRSISVWRPTTGSSFPSPACFVKLRPNWSSSFELFAFSPGAAAPPCWRRPGTGEHANDLVAESCLRRRRSRAGCAPRRLRSRARGRAGCARCRCSCGRGSALRAARAPRPSSRAA